MFDLKKNLTPVLKTTNTWTDLLDVVTEVLNDLQIEMEKKSNYLSIDSYTNQDELIDLARSLGYTPNLLVETDLAFIKKEVKDIIFKIKNKSTYFYFNYIFRLIESKGDTYILYNDYLTLVRAIDTSATLTNLNSHTLTEPFLGIIPFLHYDEFLQDPITLDGSKVDTLDQNPTWYLDQSSEEDPGIKPTNNLTIEYEVYQLYTENNKEYIVLPNYLGYLRNAVEYGRKATNIPHIGVQVTGITDKSGYFNNIDSTKSYSIPDLKLKCSVSELYDDTRDSVEEFRKVFIGNGTRELIDANYSGIKSSLDIHYSFENTHETNTETIVYDMSANGRNGIVNGAYTIGPGSSGNTINFNGLDTEIQIVNFPFTQNNRTICFWLYGNRFGQFQNNSWLVYMSGELSVYYNEPSETLYFTLVGASSSSTLSYNIDIKNKELFIMLEMDDDNDLFNLYVNNVLQDFDFITSIGSWGDTKNIYLGSQNRTNHYKGYIDEFRVYSKLLTSDEKDYLYENKIGSISGMASSYYSQWLSTNQIKEGENWVIVHTSIPAKTVNNVVIDTGDGSTNHFTGSFDYTNLEPGYVTIKYNSFPNNYTLTVDKQGNIEGDRATGTIDFENGLYDFYTYKIIKVAREVVSTKQIDEISNYTLDYSNIVSETFYITYTISGTEYTASADASGNISETGISSGSINYSTGVLNVEFTSSVDFNTEVYVRYKYQVYSTPTLDTEIIAEYKTNEDLLVKEVGLTDDNNVMKAYATFPAAKFNNVHDHISFQFAIKKYN
jgi:hypothetical protein